MEYKDFTFNIGAYSKLEEVSGAHPFVLAIRNILLGRPGNFPLTPSIGMDIEKYVHDKADENTLLAIKTELSSQISAYVANAGSVSVNVSIIKREDSGMDTDVITISVRAIVDGSTINTNYVLYEDKHGLKIYNETH